MAAHAAIHRFVDGPQLRRLRQVEQIIEEHSIVYRHHTRGERRCRRGAYRFGIAGDLNVKQAAGERTDRVVSHSVAVRWISSIRRVLPIPASPRIYTVFFLMIPRPPSTTLFPYTTLDRWFP